MTPAIKKKSFWLRVLYMLLFVVIYGLAEVVVYTVVFIQFLFIAFSGKANTKLLKFGRNLSKYIYQIMLFLTFNSEQLPYPFGLWPDD